MKDDASRNIGKSLFRFQSALRQSGTTFEEYLDRYYVQRWLDGPLISVLRIRTTFVNSIFEFLEHEGLFNIEKLQISPLTDPLAHDVEYVPSISYKGQDYLLTHSMIYAKFLACANDNLKGIFVDSPNIRLEVESPDYTQRGKYLIDFSQIDIEVKRNRHIDLNAYLNETQEVLTALSQDLEMAIDFFERLICHAISNLIEKNQNDLHDIGVSLKIPERPFPRFLKDKAKEQYGLSFETALGNSVSSQFFWITGLPRENYDLIYPYLTKEGKIKPDNIRSENVFNYDICAKSLSIEGNTAAPALEILSGGLREWLFESIVERLLDNRIIPSKPVFKNGFIENIQELGGYGPFLMLASRKNADGSNFFPETFGGGIGVERTLYAICRGPVIKKIEDLTFFGKNPDSHPFYLF